MSRKVVYAKLHAGVFIPGVGNLADTLPPASKTLTDFVMYESAFGGLILEWKNLSIAKNLSASIPSANIQVIAYEPEPLNKL